MKVKQSSKRQFEYYMEPLGGETLVSLLLVQNSELLCTVKPVAVVLVNLYC